MGPPGRVLSSSSRDVRPVEKDRVAGMDDYIGDHARRLDTRTETTEQVRLEPDDAALAIVAIDTGVRHTLTDGNYAAQRELGERARRRLGVDLLVDVSPAEAPGGLDALSSEMRRLVRHVVTENARSIDAARALRASNFSALGVLVSDSHRSLRDDYRVSCPELDLAVETSLASGALGARMTGGGCGGSAIALVPTGNIPDLDHRLQRAFQDAGHHRPRLLRAAPSPGAGRDA